MSDIKWIGKHLEIAPPKRPRKITGTRLAAILGLNKWASPFQTWCEITGAYREPFEDTKYTLAGKAIEPKQAEYMRTAYAMTDLIKPSDIWGEDYFSQTRGDFFPQHKHLGGMWDYLVGTYDPKDPGAGIEMVLEMKTTQRSEDWEKGIPSYYAIQAALYAYLLGVDDVVMVASFLEPKDYDHPENYQVSVTNTITVPFKVSERYPNFGNIIKMAEQWWDEHVVTGISPDYDEKADADVLKALRTTSLNPESDIAALITEGEALQAEIDAAGAAIEKQKKRLDNIKKQLKEYMTGQFAEGQTKVEAQGRDYIWSLSRSETSKVDEARLKQDGLYDLYKKTEVGFRMTVTKRKEAKG